MFKSILVFLLGLSLLSAQAAPQFLNRNNLTGQWNASQVNGVITVGTVSDVPKTIVGPTDGTNRYVISFTNLIQSWSGTNNIVFIGSTNRPTDPTVTRSIDIFIVPTNVTRYVYFYDQSTNWQTIGAYGQMVVAANQSVCIHAISFGTDESSVQLTINASKTVASAGNTSFNPLGIPGMACWLEGSTGLYADVQGLVPITNSSTQFVYRWNDLSGSGMFFTNSYGSSYITWNPLGAPNLHGAVNLDSPYSYAMTSTDTRLLGQPVWLFIVFNTTTTNVSGSIFTPIDNNNSGYALLNYDGNCNYRIGSTAIGQILTYNYHLIACKFDGTRVIVRTNGIEAANFTRASTTFNGLDLMRTGNGASPLHGNVAEFLVYTSALDGAAITNIETYLNTKYSLW